MGLINTLQHALSVFSGKDQTVIQDLGSSSFQDPTVYRFRPGTERSIVMAVYNQIAIDVAQINIRHVRLDQNGRYLETIDSKLNECLSLSANLDQTGRMLIQDAVMSLCDNGVIAIVPLDTSDLSALRVGEIVQWYPKHIRVKLYNEDTGNREEIVVPKSFASIIENPLYSVMNEPNSTLKRLIRKLNILDSVDEQSGSGKLDLIIQLPYTIKTPLARQQAERRRKDIEMQLKSSKYGIAYTDGAEHIVQLNRPAENNLMGQITYLTSMLYSQLGLTESVFNGTADEQTMLNYYNRTIEPIVSSIVDEMNRKFLTKTARSQGQAIMFFRDPFKLVPVNQIAEISDKLSRNEILSSNEIRSLLGYKPVNDPRADELRNSNLNRSENEQLPITTEETEEENVDEV